MRLRHKTTFDLKEVKVWKGGEFDGDYGVPTISRDLNKAGRKEMFYLTTHSTHYLRLYGVRHMVNSDSERGNPLPPLELRFSISSKGSFICTIPHTG